MPTGTLANITIKILCFAQLKDKLGQSEFSFELPAGATGRELIRDLSKRNPKAGPLLQVCRVAVNYEYIADDTSLRDGDEVVLIPPVSGG